MNLKKLIGDYAPKNIGQLIAESIKVKSPFQHFSTVMIQEPDGIIKGISQSKPNNLILDNAGEWLASFFRTPSANQKIQTTLVDEGNTGRIFCTSYHNYNDETYVAYGSTVGTGSGSYIKIGSGSTSATRADYDIETDFGTAPEDDFFGSGSGSYGGGSIGVAGAVVGGGNGTVNETGMFGHWKIMDANDVFYNVMLFHDILVSGEAFVIGETITVTYTIAL